MNATVTPPAADPAGTPAPLVSVVILNYHGARYLERCLDSLRAQTIFHQLEVIVADNDSRDGSPALAEKLLAGWPRGRFVQNSANLGYCEGNNRAVAHATGRYLFILNFDAWLEPDCLARLVAALETTGAAAASPWVLNYDDDSHQSFGSTGLDLFGLPNAAPAPAAIRVAGRGEPAADKGPTNHRDEPPVRALFCFTGCAFLIERQLFLALGGFDADFFLYSDEADLSWRVWIAGRRIVGVPAARVHHRGAVTANPEGGTRVVESRTTHSKRYYANRNAILLLAKNSQHVLLLLLLPHLLLLALEALAALALVRRWAFVREAYLKAVADAWRMRGHVRAWRRRVRGFRRRGDWWMLRFLRLKPARWEEAAKLFTTGAPKVDAR